MNSITNDMAALLLRKNLSKYKVPFLGWWPSLQDANFTPVWSHVGNQVPDFPQATGLTPSPSLPPFPSNKPTHVFNY